MLAFDPVETWVFNGASALFIDHIIWYRLGEFTGVRGSCLWCHRSEYYLIVFTVFVRADGAWIGNILEAGLKYSISIKFNGICIK